LSRARRLLLHIRARYLTALEEERWELLPGEAYAQGFLRTYAEFLGLNSDVYVDEYEARIAARVEEPFVPDSLAPRGRNRLLFRSIVGAVGLLALVVATAC
jgi:cytoskeletal protein RodZ